MKKYLPSKKFIYTAIVVLVVGLILLVTFNMFFSKKSFFSSKNNTGKLETDMLYPLNLVQKDSDGDGVPDWQESLWGTNPKNPATFDGVSDLKYIENKKKELKINPDNPDDSNLTETEKFAREFFSTYVAMKTSGQADKDAINNFSNALGQKIVDPTVVDQYSESDLKIDNSNDGAGDPKKYYSEVKKLFDNYRSTGMGDELNIVNTELTTDGKTSQDFSSKLLNISQYYRDFSSKLIKISVPKDLSEDHLKFANFGNDLSVSVGNMAKISTDPIVGLSGISQYQNYSDEFINSAKDLETKALE